MAKPLKDFKAHALSQPDVRREYERLSDEFAFLDDFLKARTESGLSQAGKTPRTRARVLRTG
jgi:hypothetical protein